MLIKFLICSTLICFTVADVQVLSRAYLPPSKQEAVVKYEVAQDSIDVANNEIITNDLKQNNPESLTKKTNNDPAYANFPHSYNGYPAVFPNQGYPAPVYLPSVYPPYHGLPPYGYPPHHGFPPQGLPRPGFPPSAGFINPGYPQPGHPVQFYPGHGYPGHGFPGQGSFNPHYSVPAQPSYPVYFSTSEQLTAEKENEDEKLRVRGFNSGTQYDEMNGGYLYKKPTVTF